LYKVVKRSERVAHPVRGSKRSSPASPSDDPRPAVHELGPALRVRVELGPRAAPDRQVRVRAEVGRVGTSTDR